MGHSQPSPFSASFATPNPNALSYNTSMYGSVVPVLWGTHRVSVNLIDAYGFTGANAGKGGKGGGGSSNSSGGGKKGGSSPTYSVYVDFGLCEGTVTFQGAQALAAGGYNAVWSNGGVAFFNAVGLNGYTGTLGQAADPTFNSGDPNQPVPGYSLTAHVTGTPMQLGQTPALPSIQFQLGGKRAGTCGTTFPDDARPDYVATDLLTDASVGAGLPATNLADISAWGTFCQAQGLAVSLLCDRQDTAARWLSMLVDATASGAWFSGTQLKIVPYASSAVSGNGASFTPSLVADYALTDADFLNWEDDPVAGPTNDRSMRRRDPIEVTRKDAAEQPNWLSLEYKPAVYWYDTELCRAFDQGAINTYGLRLRASLPGHFFTNSTSAQSSAQLQLERGLYVLNTYRFRLNISKCLVEPMDILEITESISGLSAQPVRVIAVEEDDSSTLTVTAEDMFLYSGGVTVLAQTRSKGARAIDPAASPGNTNTPLIFEPPAALSHGRNEIWVIASGGPEWGGCQVWLSLDGTTYGQYGTIYAGGRQGVLSASFPSGTDPDTTDTLSVDLSESRGSLVSAAQAAADAFATLCVADTELIAFSAATLTAQYKYNLGTYIRRGLYGTAIAAHAAGAQFGRLDHAVFKARFPPNLAPGQVFYVKLPAFNLLGLELQALSAVSAFTYTTTNAGVEILTYVNPTSGATLTATGWQPGFQIDLSGTLASLNVVMPPSPVQSQRFEIATTQTITSLSVTAPGGANVKGGTGLLEANGHMRWAYRAANNTWHRRGG